MEQDLKHLALVVDDTLDVGAAGTADVWAAGIVDHFSHLACFCLEKLPQIECLTFFYPELQRAVTERSAPPLQTSVLAGAMNRAAAAFSGLNADLSLLGFADLLPSRWASLLGAVLPPRPGSRMVHFYLGYSGREEIVRAAEEIIAAGSTSLEDGDMDRRMLSRDMPDPDLIIFSCLEFTPRDFMIWQSSYAEIWHAQLPGTECSGIEINKALAAYGQRERRFGKV